MWRVKVFIMMYLRLYQCPSVVEQHIDFVEYLDDKKRNIKKLLISEYHLILTILLIVFVFLFILVVLNDSAIGLGFSSHLWVLSLVKLIIKLGNAIPYIRLINIEMMGKMFISWYIIQINLIIKKLFLKISGILVSEFNSTRYHDIIFMSNYVRP